VIYASFRFLIFQHETQNCNKVNGCRTLFELREQQRGFWIVGQAQASVALIEYYMDCSPYIILEMSIWRIQSSAVLHIYGETVTEIFMHIIM